jgi:aryl sulfotransferase
MTHPSDPTQGRGLIWLASYPKSGNTWFRAMIGAYDDAESAVNINKLPKGHAAGLKFLEPHLGFDGSLMSEDEAREARPIVYLHVAGTDRDGPIKVHDANLPVSDGGLLFPSAATAAVVHIVRHPFDVAVSVAYHFGWAPDFGRSVTTMCDSAYKIGASAQNQFAQVLSDWGTHTLSWMDMPDVRRITLRYEDMLENAADALTRALRVMYPAVEPDHPKVLKAVEATGFERLKEQETKTSFKERPKKMESFFRSGKSGGWREHLTAEDCAMLVECLGPVMERLGYLPDGTTQAREDVAQDFSLARSVATA